MKKKKKHKKIKNILSTAGHLIHFTTLFAQAQHENYIKNCTNTFLLTSSVDAVYFFLHSKFAIRDVPWPTTDVIEPPWLMAIVQSNGEHVKKGMIWWESDRQNGSKNKENDFPSKMKVAILSPSRFLHLKFKLFFLSFSTFNPSFSNSRHKLDSQTLIWSVLIFHYS